MGKAAPAQQPTADLCNKALGQAPWDLHTDGISGTSSGSRISASSSVPPSEPGSGKSPVGWVQTSKGPEAPGLGLNHLRLEFNCPTSPLPAVACLARGLFLRKATSGPGSHPSRRKRWSEARRQRQEETGLLPPPGQPAVCPLGGWPPVESMVSGEIAQVSSSSRHSAGRWSAGPEPRVSWPLRTTCSGAGVTLLRIFQKCSFRDSQGRRGLGGK